MPRYDSVRKTERNNALIECANNHPELTLKEIGKIFGISAVRVWAILKKQREMRSNA